MNRVGLRARQLRRTSHRQTSCGLKSQSLQTAASAGHEVRPRPQRLLFRIVAPVNRVAKSLPPRSARGEKSAPEKSAKTIVALVKLAPRRSAPAKSAYWIVALVKSQALSTVRLSFAPDRSAPANDIAARVLPVRSTPRNERPARSSRLPAIPWEFTHFS